jgi:hypothetical protein
VFFLFEATHFFLFISTGEYIDQDISHLLSCFCLPAVNNCSLRETCVTLCAEQCGLRLACSDVKMEQLNLFLG